MVPGPWCIPSGLTTAALVAYGFGAVAIMSAAVASGLVATPVIERLLTVPAEARGFVWTRTDSAS